MERLDATTICKILLVVATIFTYVANRAMEVIFDNLKILSDTIIIYIKECYKLSLFFYKNNFIRTSRLKIAKNKNKTKNNPSLTMYSLCLLRTS